MNTYELTPINTYELHIKLWHPHERHGKWQRLKEFKSIEAAKSYALHFPRWSTKIVTVEEA